MLHYADNYREFSNARIMGYDPNDPRGAEIIDRMAWEGDISNVHFDVNSIQHLADILDADEFLIVRNALNEAQSIQIRIDQINEEAEQLLFKIIEAALS